jgi:hypothetical protein
MSSGLSMIHSLWVLVSAHAMLRCVADHWVVCMATMWCVVMRKSQHHNSLRHRHHPAHCVVHHWDSTPSQCGRHRHSARCTLPSMSNVARRVGTYTVPSACVRATRVSRLSHLLTPLARYFSSVPSTVHTQGASLGCGVLAWDSSAVLSFPAPTPTRLCYVEARACVASRLIPVADCVASRSLSA